MFYDPLYLILTLGCLLVSGLASLFVKINFSRGQKVPLARGLTGAEVAKRVMESAGIRDVPITQTRGLLTDHYDPVRRVLALSEAVYSGRNASAAGVAAHEAGHAIQHAARYAPLGFRSALVPAANIGSRLGPWIIIAGIVLGSAQGSGLGYNIALIGVLVFGAATLFTLVTLPVEIDASGRAKKLVRSLGLVGEGEEYRALAGVLNAAAWTYAAAALNSVLMLLYWAARAGLLSNRRRR
jgi:Zn-dependent membrane protease YugP